MWNRIVTLMILVTATSLLLIPIETQARGGGRGGGGRAGGSARGGTYGGGNVMNRTPTMSRSSTRPSVSQTRSTISGNRVQQTRQSSLQRSSAVNRNDLRNQVNQYAQSTQAQNINRQALAQRTQNFSNTRNNQIAQNRQLSQSVSQRLQQTRPDSRNWFNQDFFNRYNLDVDYARTGNNLWRPAAWATLASWGAWNWATPYYYGYDGYAYPITSSDSYSYPYSISPTQNYQTYQTNQTAQTPTTTGDWLPLGVFALASNANMIAQSNRFMQLAINRNGKIAGVLYNTSTNTARDLVGMIDPNTQKAYWLIGNYTNSPIASTGLYNLTEDQTPINVHFSDGSDQTWTLVRLQGQ